MSGEVEKFRYEGMTTEEIAAEVERRSGQTIEELADEAERGYDLSRARPLTADEAMRMPGRRGGMGVVGLRPDFVMAGVTQPDGRVLLFYSTELTQAQLERKVERWDRVPLTNNPAGPAARVPAQKATLKAEMRSFGIINAASYPEALRTLQNLWNQRDMRQALPGG